MTNAGGFVTHSATFEPYGGSLEDSGTGSSLGFTGEMHDSTGLVYLRARYADPVTGTFLTRDPVIGQIGGMSIRWNPYTYAGANPVNYIDPDGRFFWLAAAAAALVIAVGVISALDEASTQANEKGWGCVDWTKVTSAAAAGVLGTVMGLADLVPVVGIFHLAVILTGGDPAAEDSRVFHLLGLGAQYDSLASNPYFQFGKGVGSVVTLAIGAAQLYKLARSGKLVQGLKDIWRGGKSVAQGAARWAGKVWNNIPGYANTFNVGLNPSKLLSSLWRGARTIVDRVRGVYRSVEMVDSQNSPLGEFDMVDMRRGIFLENKSAQGLNTINPQTGVPQQTPAQWAAKQIYTKTFNRLTNLTTKAAATRPTKGGSPTVPTLSDIAGINRLHFRVESSAADVVASVQAQMQRLATDFQGFTFTASYGHRNLPK